MTSKVHVQASAIGWLKEDAVLKEIGNGFSVCKFCIKVLKFNRKTKEKDTIFIDCDLWGKKAETLRPMLRAGKYVSVIGTIDSFKYVTINVQDVTLLTQTEANKTENKEEIPEPPPPISPEQIEDLF